MSHSPMTTVSHLSALSDAQLGEFIKKHRRPDGSFHLPVEGWEEMPKIELDPFAERLRSVQRAVVADDATANSRALDLAKLDTLLRDVSSREDAALRDLSYDSERQTETPDDPRETYKQDETEAYNNLVNDGGHPLYPLDLLESVSKDTNAFKEMLRPFWRYPQWQSLLEDDHYDAQRVFSRQWLRWRNFRKWQLDNRGINDRGDDDELFLAHVEKRKRDYIEVGWGKYAAEIEADPNILKKPGESWYEIQRRRNWQRRYQRELGCKGILDYERAIKARLARHGFTRPFHLAEDLKQQDTLTEWIEYLGFEYWWLDRYITSVERLKLKYDSSWEELKKTGVLRDDETLEFIHSDESCRRTQRDRDDTWKAVQDAELEAKRVYQKNQKDPDRLSIPKEQRIQMLVKARLTLAAAREANDLAKRRGDLIVNFIRGSWDYIRAKEDVVNQTNLLEWVVQEAHKVEAEQQSATSKDSPGKKRKTSPEDVCIAQSTAESQGSNAAHKHGPHPSDNTVDKGNGRALRSQNRPVTSVDGRVDRHQSRNMHDANPSQTKTIGRAAEPVLSLEPEPEPEPMASNRSSRKRGKVTFKDEPLVQSNHKRRKPNVPGHGAKASRTGAGPTDVSQQLDQHQDVRDTNASSQSPVPSVPCQESIHGLRRSSRLAALSSGPGVSSAKCESRIPNSLGSKYSAVERLLEKRTRRRGRGHSTEYLVKFKGCDGPRNAWMAARNLPQSAMDEFDQFYVLRSVKVFDCTKNLPPEPQGSLTFKPAPRAKREWRIQA